MERKLYKIEKNKVLCGVCTGLAEYLRMDLSLVRILAVCFAIFGSAGVWVYLICALILPWKPDDVVGAV